MGSNPAKRATSQSRPSSSAASVGARRLFLFHWHAAEAEVHARRLRALGWLVDIEAEDGARGGTTVRANQPDGVIVYLTRLPSHGRETADYLAEAKATRHIPIIFVGGSGEGLAKTRQRVPGATFVADDAGLDAALRALPAHTR